MTLVLLIDEVHQVIYTRLPNDVHCHATVRIPVFTRVNDHVDFEGQVFSRLRQQVADFVARARHRKHDRGEYIEYGIDVYVLTPEHLYRLVNDEARRLAAYHRPAPSIEKECPCEIPG